jgi:hypothetical protein
MIVAVFRRRLKPDASFDDFISAWEADKGFGVPARVFNAVSLEDAREILSIGFVDIDAATIGSAVEAVGDQEAVRHARVDDVIESTVLHAFYDLRTEHDFTSNPRAVDAESAESLLAALRGEPTRSND